MSPLLFIPGLLCSPEVFGPQINSLWRLGPVMVASTLEASTIGDAAAKILETAPPRFSLAGLSMGGYICFEIMRQAPRRVLKLALLDTSARPDTAEQSAIRRASLAEARAGRFLDVALRNLNGLLHPARQQDRSLLGINRRMAMSVGLEGFSRQLEIAISRPDSRPSLNAIRTPTLAIVGDSDPLTPVERSEEIVSQIADSRLVVLPACGHLSPIERPELVSRALDDWLGWPAAPDS